MRSMIGCSAAMAADAALEMDRWENSRRLHRSYQKPQEPRPLAPAQARDGIPIGMCPRCGYPGPHRDWAGCVNALRDRLARFE
jgi:hypothetical protein